MRILQISSARTFGGGERHFADLCRGLSERGHTVFAAVRPTSEWQGRLDIPAERILRVSIRNSFGIFSAKRIAGFMRENSIDVIHAHAARDYIPASIACMLSKPSAFVLTRHLVFPLKPFNRYALKNVSRAIAVSKGVGESLRTVFPAEKITVIPNGIDIGTRAVNREELGSEFRAEHDIPADVPLVGIIGELLPVKGQMDLILAAAEVLKVSPDARFVIAGKDNTPDKRHRRELKRMAKVLGLEKNILWLDWVDDTARLYSALDIFVSASHSESFGLAMLEAMAYATPVVATDTAGARELLPDADWIVPVKEPFLMAEMLCDRLADRAKCIAAGEELRNAAGKRFSLSAMLDKTEQVYREVCAVSAVNV